MALETYKRGSVILVRYPFTDLSGSKIRPAIIITPTRFLSESPDVLCAFISSSLPDPVLPSDIIINSSDSGFSHTGLKRTSVLRTHKLVLLSKALVYSKLGDISASFEKKMNERLKIALGID
jgi:mRNA interferase MazF